MRHGKAEPGGESDVERELSPRGWNDSLVAGEWLADRGVVPDAALVSAARRTTSTWLAVAEGGSFEADVRYSESLYNAGPETALDLVRETPDDVRTLVVVGHNPTMAYLAQLLDVGDADADAFIAKVWHFIEDAAVLTQAIYNQLIPLDPDQAQRVANASDAINKRLAALQKGSVVLHPRIFNHGFRSAEAIAVGLYYSDAPNSALPNAKVISVDLAGGDERFLGFDHDSSGQPVPIFKLKDVDQTTGFGVPHGVSFTIDLPGRKMKEANRQNNLGGFFYYVLDVSAPVPPSTPPQPYVPFPDPKVLDPDAECDDGPALSITQRILPPSGGSFSGEGEVSLGDVITIELVVTNTSGDAQNDVVVCSNITNQCYTIGPLAVGASQTYTVTYTVPTTGVYLEGTPTAYSSDAGIVAGAPTRLTAACEPFRIIELGKNPNPETTSAMLGGTGFRYYRVVDRKTGAPKSGAQVQLQLDGPFVGGSTTKTVAFTTDAQGRVTNNAAPDPGVIPGMAIDVDASMLAGLDYFAKIASVGGIASTCAAPTEFVVNAADREYSRSYARGFGLEGSVGLIVGAELSGEVGLEMENAEKFTTGVQALTLKKTSQIGTKLGIEFSTKPAQVNLFGLKGGAEAEFGVSGTKVNGQEAEFSFPYPLTQPKNCAIAALTLEGFLGLSPLIPKLLDLVHTNPCSDPTPYLKSTATVFGREASLSAKVDFKRNLFNANDAGEHKLGVTFGASGGSGFGIETKYKSTLGEISGAVATVSTSEQYKLKGGLDVSAALGVNPADPPEGQEEQKTSIEAKKRALKTSISNTTVETYSVNFSYDRTKPVGDGYPASLQISYSPPKGFGWKRDILGAEQNLVGGLARTITYTIEDEEDVKKVVDTIANFDEIRQSNVLIGALKQLVLSPTVLTTEHEQMRELLKTVNASYEVTESFGEGSDNGLSIKGKAGPIKLGGGLIIKSDSSVSYVVERGKVVQGVSYILEQYKRDSYIPTSPLGVKASLDLAWDSLFESFSTSGTVSDISKPVDSSGPTQLKSPFTVTMNVDGRLEPAGFDAGLISWKWEPSTIAGDFHILPADTTGAPGVPHYGVGAFHQFTPDGYHLAAATQMVIDYNDAELNGADESTLAIYAFNPSRGDWDFVGGTVDTNANTVTAMVDTFHLYTLAPALPAGEVALSFVDQGVTGTGPTATERFTVTSGPITYNNGQPVPDGTTFSIRAVVGDSSSIDPYGTILTADEDPSRDNVQVTVHNGVIRFEVEYPAPNGLLVPGRVAVYSTVGTAFGQVVVKP